MYEFSITIIKPFLLNQKEFQLTVISLLCLVVVCVPFLEKNIKKQF